LVKLGSGTLTLTGDNSYGTGNADGIGTIVRGGTLSVNGGSIGHSNADLLVGQQAADEATLVIRNGGAVSGLLGIVGDGAGSAGRAVVSGTNSTWTSSDYLTVGRQGTGSLTVEKGAHVSSAGGLESLGVAQMRLKQRDRAPLCVHLDARRSSWRRRASIETHQS
jgi:T5SS/PEP-CTERM-associated repeat protein